MDWRRAPRDWRVWALVFTVQGSGALAIVRCDPSPLFVLVPAARTSTAALVLAFAAASSRAALRTPLYLLSKLAGPLGTVGIAVAVAAAVVSTAWAMARLDESIESWGSGLWIMLVLPLAVVSVGAIHTGRLAAKVP